MDKRLEDIIRETDDKLKLFENKEKLNEYNLKVGELLALIDQYLTDEEKAKLFDFPHFQTLGSTIKVGIINMITDPNLRLQLLSRNEVISDISENKQMYDIISYLDDESIRKILYDEQLLAKCELYNFELIVLITNMGEKVQTELLKDANLIKEKLHIEDEKIGKMTEELSNDEEKIEILEIYQFENEIEVNIISTLKSNSKKIDIVLHKEKFKKDDKIAILSTLDSESLSEFLREYKEFCKENNIQPYEIIFRLNSEKQRDFITKLEDIDFTLNEKRKILATLNQDVKESIDVTNLPNEYKTAISIQTTEDSKRVRIVLDLNRELEDYNGLDELIAVEPEKFNEEEKQSLLQLCDICPNLRVMNTLYSNDSLLKYTSTADEYKEAEEWISNVINSINPEYTKAQKMAIIDNAIGKKISYTPDFHTEVCNTDDSRALWKIISSGYGVCNGIAKVEKYILSKVGIESELVDGKKHTFLKVKDIELPFTNGETKKGDTILDPTWNLASHRFGGKPSNFCISYKEARENDIDEKKIDHYTHYNDEMLQDVTLGLDQESLRSLFSSVGLADEHRQFPMNELIKKSKSLDKFYENNPEENIKNQFSLLVKTFPEFATCQNSTMVALKDIIFDNKNLKCFDRCVINRVYNRQDKEKRPVVFVYLELEELGKKFYFADKTEGQFIELAEEEFTKQFECYERDIERNEGLRLWESIETKEKIDLSKSSGKMVGQESEER